MFSKNYLKFYFFCPDGMSTRSDQGVPSEVILFNWFSKMYATVVADYEWQKNQKWQKHVNWRKMVHDFVWIFHGNRFSLDFFRCDIFERFFGILVKTTSKHVKKLISFDIKWASTSANRSLFFIVRFLNKLIFFLLEPEVFSIISDGAPYLA